MPVEFLWNFAVQEGLKKVVKLAAGEIGVAWGLEKELSKLSKWLLKAEAILHDIDIRKLHHDSVRLWVDDLQDVVREADDLLDELAYEDLRRKVETEILEEVSDFCLPSIDPLVFRLETAKKIKGITETLRDQYYAASPLGLVSIESIETETDLSQIRETTSHLDECEVVGREIEVSKIVKQVIEASNQQVTSILPIVGMGGLGKTTLAKLVFHHEAIKRHFDKTIWVCVSEPFVIDEILVAMLETLTESTPNKRENLVRRLQKELEGKRYFLVLDDVWNENVKLWNLLKNCLLRMTKKSENSIIVTTRSDEVARIMETLPSHHLGKLSNDQCWSLFKASANAHGVPMTLKLDAIRKELLKKFGGIPLVARVLGGAVKFQGDCERWMKTLNSVTRIPSQDEDFVLSILKLSVDHLPFSALKQCFAYCSNFPKDYKFRKEQLIQLWIAQGFIQLPEGRSNTMMEDIGDKYFNILLSHSLFQDVIKDERGRIMHCKMHDLVHDIACAISNPQNLQSNLVGLLDKELCLKELHLVDNRRKILNCCEKGVGKLRTLICNKQMFHNKEMVFHNKIKDCVNLRALIVDLWSINNLPDSIGKLKHLRYLDISHSPIKELPVSFGVLYNLQTLRLGDIEDLPKNLRKLVSLRHLEFPLFFLDRTKQMPPHLGQLIHLQTLSGFVAGFEKSCKIEELGSLKNLKGSLVLLCLERVKSKEEAMAAKLMEKENLCELIIFEWSSHFVREDDKYNDFEVLEGLQPHKNLRSLCIENFPGELLPNGTFVENLVEIKLNCKKCKMLPMLGHLSNLEVLQISCLQGIRNIGNEFYGSDSSQKVLFPQLKEFQLYEMNNLEQWEEAVISNSTIFPRLEILNINKCPKLISIPNLFASFHGRLEVDGVNVKSLPSTQRVRNLRSLTIWGCSKLTKLPNGLEFCTSIEDLKISGCPNLTLKLQNMHSLSILNISALQKLPEGLACLTNLKELEIHGENMQDYDFSPLVHLPSLTHLQLTNNLRSRASQLPQQLEHLNALQFLGIGYFGGIEALPEWLGSLTSLETLYVHCCRNLKQLPSREAMLRLSKLTSLEVSRCPKLGLGKGDLERAKVSHVPRISISD